MKVKKKTICFACGARILFKIEFCSRPAQLTVHRHIFDQYMDVEGGKLFSYMCISQNGLMSSHSGA